MAVVNLGTAIENWGWTDIAPAFFRIFLTIKKSSALKTRGSLWGGSWSDIEVWWEKKSEKCMWSSTVYVQAMLWKTCILLDHSKQKETSLFQWSASKTQSLFSLEKRWLWGVHIAVFQYLKEACKQQGDQLFTWEDSDRTKGEIFIN